MRALVGLLDAVNALGPFCDSGVLIVDATYSNVTFKALNTPTDKGKLYEAQTTGYWDEIPEMQAYGELDAPFEDLRGAFLVECHSILKGFAALHRLDKAEVVKGDTPYEDISFIRFDDENEFISHYMIGRNREAIPYETLLFSNFTPVVDFKIDQRAAELLKMKGAETAPVNGERRFWLHMNKRGQLFASFDQEPKSDETDRTMLTNGLPYFDLLPYSYPSKPVLSAFALAKARIQVSMKIASHGPMKLGLRTNLGHYNVEIWCKSDLVSKWMPDSPELLLGEALTRYQDEECMYGDWEPPL